MHPESDYHFISSGYDSRTLLWDFRCETPLYKIGLLPTENVFSSDWNSNTKIISGGDDGSLHIHNMSEYRD